jgi:hypothetical protein
MLNVLVSEIVEECVVLENLETGDELEPALVMIVETGDVKLNIVVEIVVVRVDVDEVTLSLVKEELEPSGVVMTVEV